jgi:hypothetical protein
MTYDGNRTARREASSSSATTRLDVRLNARLRAHPSAAREVRGFWPFGFTAENGQVPQLATTLTFSILRKAPPCPSLTNDFICGKFPVFPPSVVVFGAVRARVRARHGVLLAIGVLGGSDANQADG